MTDTIREDIPTTPIAGVLLLNGNKTYGREKREQPLTSDNTKKTMKTKNMKVGKLLYKFVPHETTLPSFLVPYEMKKMDFVKVFKNVYATVLFDTWEQKHPIAKLDNIIGTVDVLEHFYEYQLYCKHLQHSIHSFQKQAQAIIGARSFEERMHDMSTQYENRTNRHVFTIDSATTTDFDDAFGICNVDGGTTVLSIYIANVAVWMETLALWKAFSNRISTIYLPNKKKPMLPTSLSEGECSLLQHVPRVAFTMDVHIRNNTIVNIEYKNTIINVSNNYIYEDSKLLSDKDYQHVFEVVQRLSASHKYTDSIHNSYDVVAYLMILMNYHCATELVKHKTGVFRSTQCVEPMPGHVPNDVKNILKIMNSTSGTYVLWSESSHLRHDMLSLDAYVHITSPIRRLVDLLNMIQLQTRLEMVVFSEDAHAFYDAWIHKIETVNKETKSIRKIQNECDMLHVCHILPNTLEKEYDCYVMNREQKNDDLYEYQGYLPELKLFSKIKTRERMENYDVKKCKLVLFNNENTFRRKVRIHLDI